MSCSEIEFERHASDMEWNLLFKFGLKADQQESIDQYKNRHRQAHKSKRSKPTSWRLAKFPDYRKFQVPYVLIIHKLHLTISYSLQGQDLLWTCNDIKDVFWRLIFNEPIPVMGCNDETTPIELTFILGALPQKTESFIITEKEKIRHAMQWFTNKTNAVTLYLS